LAFRTSSDSDVKITASQMAEVLSQISKQRFFQAQRREFHRLADKNSRHFFSTAPHSTNQINRSPSVLM
jgi:hypothetical protein